MLACNIAGKYATFMLNNPKQERTIFFSPSFFGVFIFSHFVIALSSLFPMPLEFQTIKNKLRVSREKK